MNKLFNQLNPQSQVNQAGMQQNPKLPFSNNNLKALMNSTDPQSFIQNMIKNNPKAQNLMNMFQSSGLSPKQFFYNYARNNGIDPDQFINNLK